MICHKYKFVFTHIPKTAGRSIEEFFNCGGGGHKSLSEVEKELGPNEFKNYFKWTIVRNPFERFVSMFFFREFCDDCPTSKENWSFEQWINFLLETSTQDSLVISQSNWIKIKGKIECDFIAKFENLKFDFKYVLNKLQYNDSFSLPHLNKTFHEHYSRYYKNQNLVRVIKQKCKEDFKNFNYNDTLFL